MQTRFRTDLTPATVQALRTHTFTMALSITTRHFLPSRSLARGMTSSKPHDDGKLPKSIAHMVGTLHHYGIARHGASGKIDYAWVFHNRTSHADIFVALAVPHEFISRVQGAVPHAATKARWATTMRVERLYQPEQAVGFLTDRKTFTTGLTLHTSWNLSKRLHQPSAGATAYAY